MRRPRRTRSALLALALLTAACGGDDDDVTAERATTSTTTTSRPTTSGVPATETSTSTTAPSTTATSPSTAAPTTRPTTSRPPGPAPLAQVRLRLSQVGTFAVPTAFRAHPGGRSFVAEKAGRVRDFATAKVALDIRDVVRDQGEQGLLGIAFDRSGSRLYVSYSDDPSGDTVLAEYRFAGGVADPTTRREVFRLDQPFANHNGGDIHLGPDGLLYLALGDGGGAGDPGEHGQNPQTLLGSILRIDPTRPSGGRQYGIPADNPFAGGGGGAPEVYLYGVRNPWRISFDAANGDLWVADVGQNRWEEVTHLPAAGGRGRGANLGWDDREGTHRFEDDLPPGAVNPVFEYSHDTGGCSITGGFVYRGSAIPGLAGAYLFADVCRSGIDAIRSDGRRATEHARYPLDVGGVISFGVEASGEILVLTQAGAVYRIEPA